MAEAYLKKFGGDRFIAESAGIEPGKLNPLAVQVMLEDGIDISGNDTKDVFKLHAEGRTYEMVITVCDPEAAAKCPVFPGQHQKLHWPFSDPSSFTGTETEKLKRTRAVRDQIKDAVMQLVKQAVPSV